LREIIKKKKIGEDTASAGAPRQRKNFNCDVLKRHGKLRRHNFFKPLNFSWLSLVEMVKRKFDKGNTLYI